VDADRVEKNSSSQLALSSLHVGSVEVASKASTAEGVSGSDTGLVSLNKEFTCTSSPESRSFNGSHSRWSAGNATRD